MADAQKPTTYVLMGYDHNGAFKTEDALYEKNNDCVIIRPKPGESIEDAVKNIKGPANVILEAHGGKSGNFDWNQGESASYSQLLSALPREGIESVTISGCYGGTAVAEKFLKDAPPGAVIQSRTGPDNENLGQLGTRFAEVAHKGGSSTDLFVESLVAFDPDLYQKNIESNNRYFHQNENSNPESALPHRIGIGGSSERFDIGYETLMIEQKGQSGALANDQHWVESKREVERKFAEVQAIDDRDGKNYGTHHVTTAEIEQVANKMQSGEQLKGAEEKRIGFALAAEYMDKSGELQQKINQAKGISSPEPEKHEAVVPPPDTKDFPSTSRPNPAVKTHVEPHPVVPPKDTPAVPETPNANLHPPKAAEHHTAVPTPAAKNDPAYFDTLAKEALAAFNAAHKGTDAAHASANLQTVQQEFAREAKALDTSAIHKIVEGHQLVTANRNQDSAITAELEKFAKMMHLSGVRTDAPKLNDDEIRKIQDALHVKHDGLIGEKTLGALELAEDRIKALATPVAGKAAERTQQQTH